MRATADDLDKGWAWVVAFAATLWNMLFCGILRSFGLLYVEMLHVFGARPRVASWVPGAFSISVTLIAPVSGYLSDRYSVRTMVLVAGLLGSVGLIVTAFAPNIYVAIAGYGVLTGASGGMVDGPILAHLSRFFRKRRAVANGIAFAGSSIGTLVLPLVFALLIHQYTVRGTFLVTAGLWLHVCIVGMVLLPISLPCDVSAIEQEDALSQSGNDVESSQVKQKLPSPKLFNKCNIGMQASADIHCSASPYSSVDNVASRRNFAHLDTMEETSVKEHFERKDHDFPGSIISQQSLSLNDQDSTKFNKNGSAPEIPVIGRFESVDIEKSNSLKDHRKSSILTGSQIVAYSSTPMLANDTTNKRMSSNQNLQSAISLEECAQQTRKIRNSKTCMRSTGCQLITNLKYLRLIFFLFCGFFGYLNNLFLLPPYSEDIGIDLLGASVVVSVAGFADLASRLLFGFIGDLPVVRGRRPLVANIAFFICGSAGILVPSFPDYISTMIYASVIGLFGGIFVVYMSSMIAETIGEENLGTGMGVSAMALGTASSVGPPVFGLIKETAGSYAYGVRLCGGVYLLGAIVFAVQEDIWKMWKDLLWPKSIRAKISRRYKCCMFSGGMS